MKPLSSVTAALFKPLDFDPCDCIHLVADETGTKFALQAWNARRGFASTLTGESEVIKSQPTSAVIKLISRFPEKKKIAAYGTPVAFEVPITDYTVELINDLFPREQLTFHSDDDKLLFQNQLAHSLTAEVCSQINADYKNAKIVPEHGYEFAAEHPLSPYQQVALCLAMRSIQAGGGFSLFMEQGTGKTPVGIAVACNLAKQFKEAGNSRMFRILIICPNNVRANWESEFNKFATQQGKISVLRGPEMGRFKQVYDAGRREHADDLYTVLVAGYDTVKKSLNALILKDDNIVVNSDVWDLVILDESQYIKSSKTKRWEAMELLRDKSAAHLVFTGTPIANSVLDLYTQLEFLERGCSGFSNFDQFRKFYGVYETTASGHQALVDVQNLPFMRERLARYSFIIRLKEAVPDLPDKVYDLYEVEMSSDQSDFYKDVSTQLMVEIERDLANDKLPRSMIVNNVLTKLLRLAQITSGFMSWAPIVSDDGSTLVDRRIEHFYPNPKIEGLRELMSEKTPNQKTLIWACFKADIEFIYSALSDDGFDCVRFYGETSDAQRKIAEHRFNFDPKCTVFVGNPAAGGTGLNLLGYPPGAGDDYETNCDHVIYFSQNWSSLARGQSEARASRRGTRVPTRITDLVIPGTIDEDIRVAVMKKQAHALDVSDIRSILNNVRKHIEDYNK